MDDDLRDEPYIHSVLYTCPDITDDTDMHSHLEGLEKRLGDLQDGAHVPRLVISYRSLYRRTHRKIAEDVLKLLLEGAIFSRYLSMQKVSVEHPVQPWDEISSSEILSVPTRFTLNGITISLDTAQRIKWLLHDPGDARDDYLQSLLSTTPVTTPRMAANLQLL